MINQVKDLYLEGKTTKEISKIINKSDVTVRTYLKDLKIFVPYRDYRLNYTNLDFFHEINTKEKAYWLGFIYADGYVYEKLYKTSIELSKKDIHHLQKFTNIFLKSKTISSKPNICAFTNKPSESARFEIYSKELYYDLANCGIRPCKTYEDNVDVLNCVPETLLHHFIRGVMDGDGGVTQHSNKKRIAKFYITGNLNLLNKIQTILKKNIPTLSDVEIGDRLSICSVLQYGKQDDLISIYNWLYIDSDSSILLERKYNKFKEIITEITIKSQDTLSPPFKGIRKVSMSSWMVKSSMNNKEKYFGCFNSELEAAYHYDLEQVRFRKEDALKSMNFPSKYTDFIEWISQGY